MMDLLIQVTTAHRISPAGHVIHVVSDSPTAYQPSTPIGENFLGCGQTKRELAVASRSELAVS